MANPLKLAALHWAHASVKGVRIQIPWDENYPQYGKYHFAFAKGTLRQILAFTEENCPHSDRASIQAWMKGDNPTDLHTGIDCNGFVYRVLDEACRMTGSRTLFDTMGTTCEYTPIETLTLPDQVVHRARDVRAGDTIKFNKGWHSGVVIETVLDHRGRLIEIIYAHSSFTRGPHIGRIVVGDPDAPVDDPAQNWIDDMWDWLRHNTMRDRYFTSIHHSPFYDGPRHQVARLDGIRITLEGSDIPFEVAPFILGGRTLCQVRPLAEAIGAQVSWDGTSETVTFTLGARKAACQIGSEVAYMGGQARLLDEPPFIVDGHTLVPLRFVADALGFEVAWDGARFVADLREASGGERNAPA
jgi:hypothetical protein